jgi:hypothetical protein
VRKHKNGASRNPNSACAACCALLPFMNFLKRASLATHRAELCRSDSMLLLYMLFEVFPKKASLKSEDEGKGRFKLNA